MAARASNRSSSKSPRRSSSTSPRTSGNKLSKHRTEIIVLCSDITNPDGDYQLPATQRMLHDLFPNGVTPTCLSGNPGQRFPDDLPPNKTFGLVLFAGCNVIDFLFKKESIELDMKRLATSLDDNGHIIFIDSKQYIDDYIKSDHFYERYGGTLYIKHMLDHHTVRKVKGKNYYRDAVLSMWKTLFTESEIEIKNQKYKVYTKKIQSPRKGGTRKNRR